MSGEINKRLQQLSTELDSKKLASEAFSFFKSKTPTKTGNARNKTTLNGSDIQANYPYAKLLDEGRSKQNPEGMTKPTDKFVQDYIKRQSKG